MQGTHGIEILRDTLKIGQTIEGYSALRGLLMDTYKRTIETAAADREAI